jgi:hypothetical protein
MLRYQLESEGATIASVQSNGFGDGRAFRAEGSDGQHRLIVYLFRVHNLMAFSGYEGAASAADVPSLATAVARQQEAKLFAAIAPPDAVAAAPVVPPTDVPAPIPTPTPPPETPVVVASQPSSQTAAPFCHPGDQPQFHLGFATLSSQLGPRMGAPTSCEFSDPSGSGDTLQTTTTGLATYRVATGVATFTNGSEHWALQGGVTLYWTGDSIDPADNAQPFAG